jgi:hypothetical protein
MKPINLDNSPCSPISSNCVIWQGPDIPCIKLCKGDTVSDVVYKLGMELCNIMELLDVNGYDLSCFDLASCKPQNIQELIQFLIERICAIETVQAEQAATPSTTGGNQARSASADTLVTVAPCFVVGTTTVMTIAEYAQAMGTKICGIVDQITIINTQINDLDIRVTTLENTPVVFPPTPSIVINCNIGTLISGNSYTIDNVLDALINNTTNGYCAYTSVLGTPANLTSSFTPGCVFGAPITTDPDWTVTPTNLPETLTNIWIAICSIYSSITPLTTQDSSTINLDFTANVLTARINDTGWVDLDGFGYYTGVDTLALKPQARRIGNVVHFRGLVTIPIDDGTGVPALWQYSSSPAVDTYYLSTTVTPATVGPDSVNLATAGTVTFNQGLSVIPTSIMDAGELFDNTYGTNFLIGARPVEVDAAPATSTILSGLFNLSITSTKTLVASLPKNAEQNAFSGTNAHNTSHLNYIVSHVRLGDYVPKFDNANTNVNSNAASGTIPLDMEYDSNLIYPFSCNANDEQEVGGFRIVLDGLTAYIDPCTTDIKNYTCP